MHKNYLIRRLLEEAILEKRRLFQEIQIEQINIFIDNQSQTNINSFDSLERYIPKHLHNEYYGAAHLTSDCEITVKFRDSKADVCIQIADILSNSKMRYHKGSYKNFKRIMVGKNVNEPLKLPIFWEGKC